VMPVWSETKNTVLRFIAASVPVNAYVVNFDALRLTDIDTVGGKNASLGEMIGMLSGAGVKVPGGFATTAQAYREFLAQEGLDARIRDELAKLDVDDVRALALLRHLAQLLDGEAGPPLDIGLVLACHS